MKNGEKNIAIEIKKFDVEIGRYLFEVNKDNKQPSPLQGRIIKYLSKHEGEDIYQKDLEEHCEVSKATMSQTLDALEYEKMIVRKADKNDARRKRIVLTKKSKDKAKEINKLFVSLDKKITEGLTEREISAFLNTIEKMKANLSKTPSKRKNGGK